MVSTVSFGSTYKVNNSNKEAFKAFSEFAGKKEKEQGVSLSLKDSMSPKYPYNYYAEHTLIVPDEMDSEVEAYCANNGIEFRKYETKDLLNPNAIIKRISQPEEGYRLVNINAEKLAEFANKQDTNFEHCRSDYEEYYSDSVQNMLRNGDEFPTSTLYINPLNGLDSLCGYVSRNGNSPEKFNENQLIFTLNQQTNKPDHCVCFALKDLGIKNIPMYVNDDTYKACKLLGLL
ncbi:hypothetical protein II906_04550 [bacterium]|nr:hypothetical protein [bacterium]